jgi:histone H3
MNRIVSSVFDKFRGREKNIKSSSPPDAAEPSKKTKTRQKKTPNGKTNDKKSRSESIVRKLRRSKTKSKRNRPPSPLLCEKTQSLIQGVMLTKRQKKKSHDQLTREYQKYPGLMLPRAPFIRVAKSFMNSLSTSGRQTSFRISRDGSYALQEGAESYLVEMFTKSDMLRDHAKRSTLTPRDLELALILLR